MKQSLPSAPLSLALSSHHFVCVQLLHGGADFRGRFRETEAKVGVFFHTPRLKHYFLYPTVE